MNDTIGLWPGGETKFGSMTVQEEEELSLQLIRVVEKAAIAAARTMGNGDRKESDRVATEAMRTAFEDVPIDGTIVIGEGERDEAPMLYIGEKVGPGSGNEGEYRAVDIAVDPLEGTNLCATGTPGALAVLAASEKGGLLHAPDCYMEKIIVGPACRGKVDLDLPVSENLKRIARALDRDVDDLAIVVLNRPRHEKLIREIREAGARIRLIGDGDLSAGVSVAIRGTGVHAVMGIGGAPEGVISAAAMRCLHGEMLGRLVIDTPELEERVKRMGITDPHRVYSSEDLAPGKTIIFAATGVTGGLSGGGILQGIRFFGEGCRSQTMVMTKASRKVRFVDSVHMELPPGPRGVRLY
ncbi:MAG: class II fructose-bisphosphatase [Bryobacterales bacterium]|nr:class II fructose-bisphosphatase [Bryobacterales bacterium]